MVQLLPRGPIDTAVLTIASLIEARVIYERLCSLVKTIEQYESLSRFQKKRSQNNLILRSIQDHLSKVLIVFDLRVVHQKLRQLPVMYSHPCRDLAIASQKTMSTVPASSCTPHRFDEKPQLRTRHVLRCMRHLINRIVSRESSRVPAVNNVVARLPSKFRP